eukprot:gene12303-14429_t
MLSFLQSKNGVKLDKTPLPTAAAAAATTPDKSVVATSVTTTTTSTTKSAVAANDKSTKSKSKCRLQKRKADDEEQESKSSQKDDIDDELFDDEEEKVVQHDDVEDDVEDEVEAEEEDDEIEEKSASCKGYKDYKDDYSHYRCIIYSAPTKPTSPAKPTVTASPVKEKKKEEEKKQVVDQEMADEEEEIEEDVVEEEEEDELSGSDEEEDEPVAKKTATKFIRKQVVSKNKGAAKQLEHELARLAKYNPIKDASWKKDQKVPYMALAKTFEAIEETSRRLLIVENLTNLFRSVMVLSPKDLINTIYLSINKIGPSYEGKELGIGESILLKAVAETTGRSAEFIKNELREAGDLGTVAQSSRMTQTMMFPPPPLTIDGVFKTLQSIANLTGNSSQNKKKDLITKLLVSCKECEPLYIIRSLQGKLRIGLAETSVLTALSRALTITPPSATYDVLDVRKNMTSDEFQSKVEQSIAKISRAYSQLPNYDILVPLLLKEGGVDSILETCSLRVGTPVKPMLAQPTNGISQVLDRFQEMEFTCEFKYDGERVQIHKMDNGDVVIYTRNLENYTQKYPDIIANIPKFINDNVTNFILDCEAVAFDVATNKILPFQVLSSRPRKSTGVFAFAQFANISDVNEIQAYIEEAINGNCEGLMVKTLKEKSIYEPSKRSYNWLKIKKDYMQGMTDSVDVVPIGAWYGKGKRTGVYGAYLLACYDESNEDYQTLCKIGTGFSDELLQQFTKELKPHVISNPKNMYRVAEQMKPDVWFDPVQVWEVLAADLSISPIHTAAAGEIDPVKGIALRFPRFKRIREDKSPEDATSSTQIVDMYKNQKINTKSDPSKDESFYM